MKFLQELEENTFKGIYQMLRDLGYRSAINLSNYPEAALGFELDTGEIHPKFIGGNIILDIVRHGYIAITADAFNNLSDAGSSLVSLVSFRMAAKPADREHPFGHARIEYVASLLVAVIIIIVGWTLFTDSFGTLIPLLNGEASAEAARVELLTIIVLAVSILVKLWMFFFSRSLGKRIGSTTLKATAIDSRNDVLASAAVFIGCTVEQLTGVSVDGIAALAVALFILYSGVKLTGETISPLLGKKADDELIEQISDLVLSHEQVLGIHDLLVHDYGPGKCYASVHAEMSADEDPIVSHEIIDHIEKETLERMNVNLVIHFDPVDYQRK